MLISPIEDIRAGKMVIVCNDKDRESEGDLTMAAELVTPEDINFMATHGRGLIFLPMRAEMLDGPQILDMVRHNYSRLGTAFTVSIEAREGITTGISAADRARTIQVAVDDGSGPNDRVTPGRVFPCALETARCCGAPVTLRPQSIWRTSRASSRRAISARS